MLTLEGLIGIISLCLTAYGLGYSVGLNNAKHEVLQVPDSFIVLETFPFQTILFVPIGIYL